MSENIDQIDRKILNTVQTDASQSVELVAAQVHLSKNACWRRMRALEDKGFIKKRVAILDPEQLNLGQQVFVLVSAKEHSPEWLATFKRALDTLPEVVGAYRTSGELDYLLQVMVAAVKGYDSFYQQLIALVPNTNISASFVMEVLRQTTAIPLRV